jgi:aquaporin Z
MHPRLSKALSESLGTFCLVFFGAGTAACLTCVGAPWFATHALTAVSFGVVVALMIKLFGDHSGAHLNPAITVGFLIAQRLSLRDALAYIVGQCVGATIAAITIERVLSFYEGVTSEMLQATMTRPAVPQSVAFSLETLLTLILMFVVLRVSTGSKERGTGAALAIGATVFLCAAAFGPITGASMNPARSLGPAFVLWIRQDLWIYVTAPVLGAIAAVPLCRILSIGTEETNDEPTEE